MHPDQKDDDRRITYFAATNTRGKRNMFGIRAIDRGKHMYVIGKSGMGKSTMLENLAIQDIQNGEGIAFVDPHGSSAEKLLDFVPHDRIKDVVYFAPFDIDYPMGFNVMEDVGYEKRHLVVSGLMGAFKRIWVDAWSARMEYFLQNTLLALLEYPGSTLLDVNRMLINANFRDAVVANIKDPIVRSFWTEEFKAMSDTYVKDATPAIQNKIGQFVSNPLIRNIVGQAQSTFDIRKMMDEKKIFIVNLSKGRMGETNAALIGSMLVVKIYLAAMSRAEEPAARMARLPRFYFYVDEFQSMMNDSFADILSESRKYKLALTLANQYIEQMEENVRNAVFGNIGSLITFRVGPFDAEALKIIFEPTFLPEDLVGLGTGEIYLSLMIDGVGSAPFSAQTIPPIEAPNISYREDIIQNSRAVNGVSRQSVEKSVLDRQELFPAPSPKPKEKKDYRPSATQGSSAPYPTRRDDVPSSFKRDVQVVNSKPLVPSTAPIRPATIVNTQNVVVNSTVVNHAPRPAAPMDQKATPQIKNVPTSQRNSLRDALAQVTSVPSVTKQPEIKPKSPLDILREKQKTKPVPASPLKSFVEVVKTRVPEKSVMAPNPPKKIDETPSTTTENGEVSSEFLRQLLDSNQERGHAKV